jgi:hypothetical protein
MLCYTESPPKDKEETGQNKAVMARALIQISIQGCYLFDRRVKVAYDDGDVEESLPSEDVVEVMEQTQGWVMHRSRAYRA